MKSYPSAFVVDPLVSAGNISGNLAQSVKNVGETMMHNALHTPGSDSGVQRQEIGALLDPHNPDPKRAIQSTANAMDNTLYYSSVNLNGFNAMVYPEGFGSSSNLMQDYQQVMYENVFKIPSNVLMDVNKYRKIKKDAVIDLDAGSLLGDDGTEQKNDKLVGGKHSSKTKDNKKSSTQKYLNYTMEAVSSSLFNPFYAVRTTGVTKYTPKMYTDSLVEDGKVTGGIIRGFVLNFNTKNAKDDAAANAKAENYEVDMNQNATGDKTRQPSHMSANSNSMIDDPTKNPKANPHAQEAWQKAQAKGETTSSMKTEWTDAGGPDGKHKFKADLQAVQLGLNKENSFTDCTIKKLVELSGFRWNRSGNKTKRSHHHGLGRGTYRYSDFMFCKEVGKIPNNRLITLRRFSHPVGDNIFSHSTGITGETFLEVNDRGRLVTWFGTEDNKLEDICKYSMSLSYRNMQSKIQDIQVNNQEGGSMGSALFNLFSPQYANMVRAGRAGSENPILGRMSSASSWFDNKGTYESPQFHRDANKVWEPKNTIQEVNYYEGKIQFAHEFTLVFNYQIRHYDGINGKAAFIDLLGNILRVCTVEGKFWGGKIRVHGKGFTPGWHKMNKLLNALERGANNIIDQIFGCTSWAELGEWCMDMLNSAVDMVKGMYEKAKEMFTTPEGQAKLRGWGAMLAKNAVKMGVGMMKNKMGRPAAYAADSLLNGSNTGMWHVTIGNPRAPIMVMGNLMLANAEVQHYGPLGLDDFPTNIKVTCSLKHARPRDLTDISKMYTIGQGGSILKMSTKRLNNYFNLTDPETVADLGYSAELLHYGIFDHASEESIKAADESNEIQSGDGFLVSTDLVESVWSNM